MHETNPHTSPSLATHHRPPLITEKGNCMAVRKQEVGCEQEWVTQTEVTSPTRR